MGGNSDSSVKFIGHVIWYTFPPLPKERAFRWCALCPPSPVYVGRSVAAGSSLAGPWDREALCLPSSCPLHCSRCSALSRAHARSLNPVAFLQRCSCGTDQNCLWY